MGTLVIVLLVVAVPDKSDGIAFVGIEPLYRTIFWYEQFEYASASVELLPNRK